MENTTMINNEMKSVVSVSSFDNGYIAVDIITFNEDESMVGRSYQKLYLNPKTAMILVAGLIKETKRNLSEKSDDGTRR